MIIGHVTLRVDKDERRDGYLATLSIQRGEQQAALQSIQPDPTVAINHVLDEFRKQTLSIWERERKGG